MQYGLGAQAEPAAGAIDFAAARKHIYEVEARFNVPIFNPGAGASQVPGPASPDQDHRHPHLHITE